MAAEYCKGVNELFAADWEPGARAGELRVLMKR